MVYVIDFIEQNVSEYRNLRVCETVATLQPDLWRCGDTTGPQHGYFCMSLCIDLESFTVATMEDPPQGLHFILFFFISNVNQSDIQSSSINRKVKKFRIKMVTFTFQSQHVVYVKVFISKT